MSNSDEEKIEDIIYELNLKKFDYNRTELTNIRNRAHHIMGFCFIFISIIIGFLAVDTINKILSYVSFTTILLAGIILLIISMIKLYLIMIRKFKDPLLDPEATFKTLSSGNFSTMKKELRNSIFSEHKTIDERNYNLKTEMWEIYEHVPISVIIIFIPIISSYWL